MWSTETSVVTYHMNANIFPCLCHLHSNIHNNDLFIFVISDSPRNFSLLHTLAWVLNLFGIFFILAGHEHYSIDVIIAFYITSRMFLYYHSLANNRALSQDDERTSVWFPMFSYFEANVDGIVPNVYEWPCRYPKFLKEWFDSEKDAID